VDPVAVDNLHHFQLERPVKETMVVLEESIIHRVHLVEAAEAVEVLEMLAPALVVRQQAVQVLQIA
jgi:hypothetical protein